MNDLRNAATRERRAPILWWFLMIATMGGMLCILLWHHSHDFSLFLAFLLFGIWFAPFVAFYSLLAPRRAKTSPPAPGEGTYSQWIKQARLLGRLLLYYEENKQLSPEVHATILAARKDLHDTLKAHPLSDDLERVCGRIRADALSYVKNDLWKANTPRVDNLIHAMEEQIASCSDVDEVPVIQHKAMEDVAALMARYCMPRLLERERLACAMECSWLATVGVYMAEGMRSPVEVAARLVIEWSDFSVPWHPAQILRKVLKQVGGRPLKKWELITVSSLQPSPVEPPAAQEPVATEDESTAAAEASPSPAPKRRRVRVRVRRDHPHSRHRKRGLSSLDILLSFGQWIRYSIRSWMLYR